MNEYIILEVQGPKHGPYFLVPAEGFQAFAPSLCHLLKKLNLPHEKLMFSIKSVSEHAHHYKKITNKNVSKVDF